MKYFQMMLDGVYTSFVEALPSTATRRCSSTTEFRHELFSYLGKDGSLTKPDEENTVGAEGVQSNTCGLLPWQ